MGRKQWVVEGGVDNDANWFFNRSWIPFVSFHCPEFVGNEPTQTPLIDLNSKMWFTDQ